MLPLLKMLLLMQSAKLRETPLYHNDEERLSHLIVYWSILPRFLSLNYQISKERPHEISPFYTPISYILTPCDFQLIYSYFDLLPLLLPILDFVRLYADDFTMHANFASRLL